MIKERRKHARLRIPLEAEYQVAGEDAWRQGTIWTLGAGGAALLCDERLDEGTVLAGLHFVVEAEGDLPETRIEVGAEVVHVDREGDFGCRSCFLLGLRFRGLGEQEFELLRQFVFRRLTGAQPPPVEAEADAGETAGAPPIEIRFKLFDEFVDEVSENLSPTGMFIRAHRPLPPGSRFAFQFQLGDDFSLFQGTAEVVWTRRRSEGSDRPPGMGVRFVELDLSSQRMVKRLVDQREAEAAAEPGAPAPAPGSLVGADEDDLPGPAEPPALAAEPAPPAGAFVEPGLPAVAEEPPPAPAEAVAEPASPADATQTAGGEAAPSRLRRLEERLSEAEAAADQARERLARLDAEAGTLREELLAERSSRAEAESARERAESAAAELRGELDEAARGAREELVRRQAEWGALESELRERLDRSQAERGDLERLAERATAAESDLDRLRQESAEARREWRALESELRGQLERMSAERADLEDRLSQAAGATAELHQQLGELRQTRDELEERVVCDARVEAELREQAQELRAAPAELEARLGRAAEQLCRLRGAAEAMQSRLDGDLGAARSLDRDLADRLAEVSAVGSSLEDKLAGLSAARAGLADRLARLVEARSELADGLAQSEPEAGDHGGLPAPAPADASEAALEPAAASASEAVSADGGDGARRPEPSAAARLVDVARRAAARLGLARAVATDGNGAAGGNGSGPDAAASATELAAEPAFADNGAGAAAIEATVRAWAAAWSEQRVEDYLSFYSREFEPVQPAADDDAGEAPHAWLPPLAGMELTLGPISHTELAPGRFAVQFEQRVATDTYARRTGRTLELVRESDAWKIAAESFQEL